MLLTRLKRRGSDEQGVVMVVVAFLLVALLGLAALAIDIGSYDQAQRQAQAAADAGALAAAQDLPGNTPLAAGDATSYAHTNFPGSTVAVDTTSTTNQVTVDVNATTPTFFGKLLGLNTEAISARAVAGAGSSGGPKYAMFSKSDQCGNTLYLQQGNLILNGGIHTNGGIRQSGSNNAYGSGSYNSACSFQDDTAGRGNDLYGGKPAPTTAPVTGWPEDYAPYFPVIPFSKGGDPNCNYIGGDLSIQNQSGQTLASGTYCYATIEFNSSNLTCTCTFVASSGIQFNQGPDRFTPFFKDLSFYDMESNPNLNANGTSFFNGGTDFFPNANPLIINAPSGAVSGFIEAQSITVNGGGPTQWNGSGPATGGAAGTPSLLR